MPAFRTVFNGYSIKFSPFLEGRVAVATSQNFGIIGNGRQYVLDAVPGGGALQEAAVFDTADGLYDCCWSEANENVLVSASGDGSVKVWDVAAPPGANPLRSFEEHTHEVYCVSYNPVRRDAFLSASWDDTVRLWSLESGLPGSARVFAEHTYCVYSASWNARHADLFASASGDCTVRVWDLREPRCTLAIPAHSMEALSVDWNKYNDCILATGSVDKSVRVWDVRSPAQPLAEMLGHTYAIRRVVCSPFHEALVASCSYDMSVRLWDWTAAAAGGMGIGAKAGGPPGPPGQAGLVHRYDHHTEFVVGLDLSCLVDGLVASAGWDEAAFVWRQGGDPRAPLVL